MAVHPQESQLHIADTIVASLDRSSLAIALQQQDE